MYVIIYYSILLYQLSARVPKNDFLVCVRVRVRVCVHACVDWCVRVCATKINFIFFVSGELGHALNHSDSIYIVTIPELAPVCKAAHKLCPSIKVSLLPLPVT